MEITYEYVFEGGRAEKFSVNIDDVSMVMKPLERISEAPWMQLSCHQCSGCPLSESTTALCPVARNLAPVLLRFNNDKSYTRTTVRMCMRGRLTEKNAPLHEGLSPLMGLIMATSGCPQLDMFKPMAFTHLPFASEDETVFRAVAAHLMAQFVRMKNGKTPDWDLTGLRERYAQVSNINAAFVERLRDQKGADANVSALVLLDLFAQFGSFTLNDDWVESIKSIFSAYL
jgi:hypothetical protein